MSSRFRVVGSARLNRWPKATASLWLRRVNYLQLQYRLSVRCDMAERGLGPPFGCGDLIEVAELHYLWVGDGPLRMRVDDILFVEESHIGAFAELRGDVGLRRWKRSPGC